MGNIRFYGYSKCGTCRAARKWLKDHGVQFEEIEIREHPPSAEEIKNMVELSGLDIKQFFNTSGELYRSMGLKDKLADMTFEEKVKLLASNGMLIKRPIVTDGTKVTVGFDEREYQDNWLTY